MYVVNQAKVEVVKFYLRLSIDFGLYVEDLRLVFIKTEILLM